MKFKIGDKVLVTHIRDIKELADGEEYKYYIGKSGKVISLNDEEPSVEIKFRKNIIDFYEEELVPYGKAAKILFKGN